MIFVMILHDIPHLLLLCPNVKIFWKSCAKWWFCRTNIDIRNVDHLQENILFGCVSTNSITDVLNYCILYAKYYTYIQRLFNNKKFDVYACLTFFKNILKLEWLISISNNKLDNLFIRPNSADLLFLISFLDTLKMVNWNNKF